MAKTRKCNTRSIYLSNRIREALGEISDHPLTVVEAPMGYGKTTAVREYLNMAGAHTLWQTVDESHASNFWSEFSGLFADLDRAGAQSLAQLGLPVNSTARHEALRLIKGIQLPGKTVIVIDDFHLVDQPDIQNLIVFLARNQVRNLHIVIATRGATLESLDELELKGYAHHITKEAFELRAEEIVKYYGICGIALGTDQANSLYACTEGWISALYLFMLNFIKTGAFELELPGSRSPQLPSIYSLLEKTVYTPLAEEAREFLLTVCIFDHFTAEQAASVWQGQDAVALLAGLLDRNAFLTYEAKTRTYYLHNIFTSFLRGLLEKRDSAYRQALYGRAARWYLKAGDHLATMQHSYLAGDFDNLLAAVERDRANSITGDHRGIFIRYFEECPPEIRRRHSLALCVYGKHLLTFHEKELFAKVCAEIGEIKDSLDPDQKNRLLGEYELMLSFTEYNDIVKMSQRHQKAQALLKKPSVVFDANCSWCYAPSILFLFHRESGRLEQEVEDLKASAPYYYQLTDGHGKGAENVMAAERHFNLGEFESAEILAYKALYLARAPVQPEIAVCAMFLQARLAFLRGDFGYTLFLFKRMREQAFERKSYPLLQTIDMCEAFVYSTLKQKDRIPSWIACGDFERSRILFTVKPFLNIISGRILLVNSEYLKLIGISEQFLAEASIYPNLLAQIYIHIHLSAANQKIFRDDQALDSLRQALVMAMPDRLYLPFLENCDYIAPLLEQLGREGVYPDAITRILELYSTYRKASEQMIKEYFTGKQPALTGREKEIARLVADGLTNREIAERLFISANTVKTQIKSIFEKLGVSSRSLLAHGVISRQM
jgi:LuxR family maltose regulon positive regulatory protein